MRVEEGRSHGRTLSPGLDCMNALRTHEDFCLPVSGSCTSRLLPSRGRYLREDGKGKTLVVVRRFPAEPWAVPAARRIVHMTTPDISKGTAHDVDLVTTELVTNSVKHGVGPVELRVRFGPGQPLRIEVVDQGGGFEPELPLIPPAAGETAGRGLCVVDQLADRWGIDSGGATWAEFGPFTSPQAR
jgi:anti-sigma regulatory factor (Ser/Thr protein kinase)